MDYMYIQLQNAEPSKARRRSIRTQVRTRASHAINMPQVSQWTRLLILSIRRVSILLWKASRRCHASDLL